MAHAGLLRLTSPDFAYFALQQKRGNRSKAKNN